LGAVHGLPKTTYSKPNRGQNAQIGGFGTTICDRDFDQDIFDIGLGIFHQYVEVPGILPWPW